MEKLWYINYHYIKVCKFYINTIFEFSNSCIWTLIYEINNTYEMFLFFYVQQSSLLIFIKQNKFLDLVLKNIRGIFRRNISLIIHCGTFGEYRSHVSLSHEKDSFFHHKAVKHPFLEITCMQINSFHLLFFTYESFSFSLAIFSNSFG